jgi:ADP-ribose pyrophosphatase YjhB (NUDIX family)
VSAPLPQAEYEEIFKRVPRLTAEVVVCSGSGVLLARRVGGPCDGLWNVPGGTVRFAETLVEAVHRVALDEIGADVVVDDFLGYIEYPSHALQGIDWPVGLAFRTHLDVPGGDLSITVSDRLEWFDQLPADMHDEQRAFLHRHDLAR